MNHADHFSTVAVDYQRYRPDYPAALFAFLADAAPSRQRAWDAATGSGQAACGLAQCFDRVLATDAAPAQLASAPRRGNVAYLAAASEAVPLAACSIDLVTVAQALHWFELTAFYAEAKRVLRPGGVLACWCYGLLQLPDPAMQAMLQAFYRDTVGPFWPAERALVDTAYRGLPFPFPAIAAPTFALARTMTLAELAGYLGTWSATLRYRAALGEDPVPALRAALAAHWGAEDTALPVQWPLHLTLGRS